MPDFDTNQIIARLENIQSDIGDIKDTVLRIDTRQDGLRQWRSGHEEKTIAQDKEIASLSRRFEALAAKVSNWGWANSGASAIAGLLALFLK